MSKTFEEKANDIQTPNEHEGHMTLDCPVYINAEQTKCLSFKNEP